MRPPLRHAGLIAELAGVLCVTAVPENPDRFAGRHDPLRGDVDPVDDACWALRPAG
jgi:hypothetical protein